MLKVLSMAMRLVGTIMAAKITPSVAKSVISSIKK